MGIFSDALYDSISGAVFLISPYSTHAKVSYFLTTDYDAPYRPKLRPYPSFEMNHMRVGLVNHIPSAFLLITIYICSARMDPGETPEATSIDLSGPLMRITSTVLAVMLS